MALGITKD